MLKRYLSWIKLLKYCDNLDPWYLYEVERQQLLTIHNHLDLSLKSISTSNINIISDIKKDIYINNTLISLLNIILRYEEIDYNNKLVNFKNSEYYKAYKNENINYDKEELNRLIYEHKAIKIYHLLRIQYLSPYIQ